MLSSGISHKGHRGLGELPILQERSFPPTSGGALVDEPTRKGGATIGGDLVNDTHLSAKASNLLPLDGGGLRWG